MKTFLNSLNCHLQGLGFTDTHDLLTSTLHTDKDWTPVLTLAGAATAVVGGAEHYIESCLGLHTAMYIGLLMLLATEFISGIKANFRLGKKLTVPAFGRMVSKIGFYTIILYCLWSFTKSGDFMAYIWKWIHIVFFNIVAVNILISILTNLNTGGYSETKPILRLITKKFNKWFDLTGDETK